MRVTGKQFFKILSEDQEFCAQLGRTMLAASVIESELKLYLKANSVDTAHRPLTFGQLIGLLKKYQLLVKMQPALMMLKMQRNYLAHNLHALLIGMIDETLLPRENLIDLDVHTYRDRARESEENLMGLSETISKERKAISRRVKNRNAAGELT